MLKSIEQHPGSQTLKAEIGDSNGPCANKFKHTERVYSDSFLWSYDPLSLELIQIDLGASEKVSDHFVTILLMLV